MKVLIQIGHTHVLLPNDTGLSIIMKQLSKGVVVYDHRYHNTPHFEVRCEVEMKTEYISKDIPVVDPDKKASPATSKRRAIEIQQPERVLLLPGGSGS